MADSKCLMVEPSDVPDDARSLDMDTAVKSEPADVDDQLDEDGVYTVKLEVEIGPEVIQPPDLQYVPLPCKPEPAGDASRIKPGHLTKNEPNDALIQDNSGVVRSASRAQYICDICNRSFVLKANLQRHLSRHTFERSHKLDLDKQRFSKSRLLTHTEERPHKCIFCKKSFSYKSTLNTHVMTHTGERSHKCDICKKYFIRKYQLNVHMLTHTGERPHECDICKKPFSRKYHLKTHMLTHRGERPHKCNCCKKSFTDKSTLRSHMLTHTGERPHKCNICSKSFARKHTLNCHISTHIGELRLHE